MDVDQTDLDATQRFGPVVQADLESHHPSGHIDGPCLQADDLSGLGNQKPGLDAPYCIGLGGQAKLQSPQVGGVVDDAQLGSHGVSVLVEEAQYDTVDIGFWGPVPQGGLDAKKVTGIGVLVEESRQLESDSGGVAGVPVDQGAQLESEYGHPLALVVENSALEHSSITEGDIGQSHIQAVDVAVYPHEGADTDAYDALISSGRGEDSRENTQGERGDIPGGCGGDGEEQQKKIWESGHFRRIAQNFH